MSSGSATPMMRQYLEVKEAYPDEILFYRMGDFYEMFFEDAELASRLLDITLTSRNKKAESPIPMCGVPYRAVQGYIARLIDLGYKVAICDQVADPATSQGLVKREVVRVITPGMVLENELLDEKSNNYVLAASVDNDRIGLSYLDISTGTFRVTESDDLDEMVQETYRIAPREVLLPNGNGDTPLNAYIDAVQNLNPTHLETNAFEFSRARERLLKTLGTVSLEGFGCDHLRAGLCAAGALIHYVHETQKQTVTHIRNIEPYRLDSYLFLDDQSYHNLEIEKNLRTGNRKGSLIAVIDQTVTAMGSRLLKQWIRYPLTDADRITSRFDAIDEARDQFQTAQTIRGHLKKINDVERLRSKISMGHANARDLLSLKQSLQQLPPIETLLDSYHSPSFKFTYHSAGLNALADSIDQAIREDAAPTLHDGGIVREGFSPALDELIQMTRDGKSWLVDLEARERERTGINALKVRYNKVFGYYLEIPKSRLDAVPSEYIRKQTLVNAERFITPELKEFEEKVTSAEGKRADLEFAIFNELKDQVVQKNTDLQKAGAFVARLDCLSALAVVSLDNHYTRPEINSEGYIRIEESRHPVIEKMIPGERFVPNTIAVDNQENQVLVITGPNMAGKSTILRQVALAVLMAQMGSFVPAARASLSMTDRIFTRVGALDNLSQGQSTFLVEMQETANILNNATADSLVIMDEIGRGTSTYDGLSLAWAVVEFLHDARGTGVKTLFATHYHELTELAQEKQRVRNFNIAVKEWNDEIIFLRKLVPGGTNRSYGIQVARLAGIPDSVIDKAKTILNDIENGHHSGTERAGSHRAGAEQKGIPYQLELFQGKDHAIRNELAGIDISRMTPMDALNYLHDLQQKIKAGQNLS